MSEAEVQTIMARQWSIHDDVKIDGKDNEKFWKKCRSYPINKSTGMNPPSGKADFSGRFRMAWGTVNLYALVEVKDDFLAERLH